MIKTIFNLPADDVDRVSGLDDVTVYSTQQGTIAPIINHKEGLCANQWFRQAVSYALDYEEVMTATYGANGFTMGACYMDEAQPFWYTDAGSEEYNVHDPEKAKEILKEHGYDGTPLRLTAATLNKMDYMAVAMQSELEEVGIPVELNIVDWPTL
ncbi:ABC transporter substrate-binding protein [Pilosibacter sp. HC1M1C21]|uniref:ABC transporter substrate-binding protein n=1 Tax=Pilosibacter sp. HC1M1C21 TaxID=3378803 RepID=UPI00385D184A